MKENSITEFYIYKWMEDNGFYMPNFQIVFNGNEAIITDKNKDVLILEYKDRVVREKAY